MNMENPEEPEVDFDLKAYLPEKWYNALKGLSTVILPAVATLVLVLGSQWDWSSEEKIAGTLTALATFLGLLVRSSAARFKKATNVGDVVVTTDDTGRTLYDLQVGVPIDQINQVPQLTFNVKKG